MASRGNYKVGQKRLDNEAAILAAAQEEFADQGFNGASMSRIADQAGVPRTNVHYYFSSKEELYTRVLGEILDMWNETFPPITATENPAEAMTAYIAAKVDYSRSNPQASRVFASEVLRGAPVLRDYLRKHHRHWLRDTVQVLQSWIDAGRMDAVDPYHLMFLIWGATQHYADFQVQVESALSKRKLTRADYQTATDTITHIVLRGCGLRD